MIEGRRAPIRVLLAPGFGGDPLYLRSRTGQAHGNLDLDRLPLSQQLKDELRGWEQLRRQAWAAIDTTETIATTGTTGTSSGNATSNATAGEQQLRTWSQQAHRLLARTRQELGAAYEVQFIGDAYGT